MFYVVVFSSDASYSGLIFCVGGWGGDMGGGSNFLVNLALTWTGL